MLESRGGADDGRGLVVFLHGLWMHATSWAPWVDLFDASGYDGVVVSWPDEAPTVQAGRDSWRPPGRHAVSGIADHLAAVIHSLPRPPLV